MEAHPPTYEIATLTDPWDLIAPSLPSHDLCSASLVCHRWHATFTPHIWGNPASHFGIENDRVYVALARFKRTLSTARLLVRSMTHTLHLPPAHAEIYNGPNADWLREVLARLPNLQSLVVRGLPFFDHASLLALRFAGKVERAGSAEVPEGVVELPAEGGANGLAMHAMMMARTGSGSNGLRLLDASRCGNVTATGLVLALEKFETLLYLDLSFTPPARDVKVLRTLRKFSGLQVLKLRGLGLPDEAIGVLANAIGLTVRSLDVRDNQITDRGVRTLLDSCFTLAEEHPSHSNYGQPTRSRSPGLLPYLGTEMLDIYQGEDFEGYLRRTFTGGFVSRLAIEDAPAGGITHLYMSGNLITAEGASGLLRSGRMHVLDLGPVQRGWTRHMSSSGRPRSDTDVMIPGVEKLTPVLSRHASEALTFLRINHAVVTQEIAPSHPEEIIHGRVELADTALPDLPRDAYELDSTSVRPEATELPAIHTPIAELPGDPMEAVGSPTNSVPPIYREEPSPPCARRGSAFAPEVVGNLTIEADRMTLLSPVSAMDDATSGWGTYDPTTTTPPSPISTVPPSANPGRHPRSYSSLVIERTARLNAHTSLHHTLHPAMLPHIHSLILTDIPAMTTSSDTADHIIDFVRACAEESYFAHRHAHLDYSLPPGRKGHASALAHSAEKIFALKRIVLELAPERTRDGKSSRASPWQHLSTRSVTEDRDTETLWNAAETDFSFFGDDDDDEYGLTNLDANGRAGRTSMFEDKQVAVATNDVQPHTSPFSPQGPSENEAKVDTIALISAFRKERRLAHERNLAAGAVEPETEGYWEGVVQVVRPPIGGVARADEEVDYYGNRFIGGIYR